MITAAHCAIDAGASSGANVYTNNSNHVVMGTVSTLYLNSQHVDIASIRGNFDGLVHADGQTVDSVIGAFKATRGEKVTADGRVSGEVRDVVVENIDQDVYIADFGITIKHATTATKSGAKICQVGDSGGPWYQHNNTGGEITAAGIQSAERQDENGNLDPSVCTYEQITNMLGQYLNGTIKT